MTFPNPNLVGVQYVSVGQRILLYPGQPIPNGWKLAEGQYSWLGTYQNTWREIVKDVPPKPNTVALNIWQIVERAKTQPVRVWLDDRVQAASAIQVPMSNVTNSGIARTFCITLGYSTHTFPIDSTLEVVL